MKSTKKDSDRKREIRLERTEKKNLLSFLL